VCELNAVCYERQKDMAKRCEKCGSNNNYMRIKTNQFVCRKCGHIYSINQDMKGGNKNKNV
jgi:ribosomal protein L37AE/L43A